MKKLNKKTLDKCIDMTRQFWSGEAGGTKFLNDRITAAKESSVEWDCLLNLLDGILASFGFNPEASNYDIYIILRILGWEVVNDEVQEGESL